MLWSVCVCVCECVSEYCMYVCTCTQVGYVHMCVCIYISYMQVYILYVCQVLYERIYVDKPMVWMDVRLLQYDWLGRWVCGYVWVCVYVGMSVSDTCVYLYPWLGKYICVCIFTLVFILTVCMLRWLGKNTLVQVKLRGCVQVGVCKEMYVQGIQGCVQKIG